MTDEDVAAAAAEMLRVLGPRADADWTVQAGPLDWDCRATAAHVAHDLAAYAGQLAGLPAGRYLPFDLVVQAAAAPRDVLAVVAACAGMLGSLLATAPPDARAWHWGPCDPGGFAAMGVAEILLHTHDITRSLGPHWQPPADLSARVLRRLFPAAPDGDPAPVLLWCTGRGDLPGRARRAEWSWRAALPA